MNGINQNVSTTGFGIQNAITQMGIAKMHIGETIATLRDMWHDADPDLREKMKKDFSALLQEMN